MTSIDPDLLIWELRLRARAISGRAVREWAVMIVRIRSFIFSSLDSSQCQAFQSGEKGHCEQVFWTFRIRHPALPKGLFGQFLEHSFSY